MYFTESTTISTTKYSPKYFPFVGKHNLLPFAIVENVIGTYFA